MARFRSSFLVAFLLLCWCAEAKEIYRPTQFDRVPEVSNQRMAQSANFVAWWGEICGTDPANCPGNPALKFDPQKALGYLEEVYDFYVNKMKFIDGNRGNMAKYKFIVIMNDTWRNGEWKGYAFGGGYDGVIGAMWCSPVIFHPRHNGIAHELAHSMQAMVGIDYPGRGFNTDPAGFFWEAHANWMGAQMFYEGWRDVDLLRWLNTQHFHFSSTRHHYQNIYFLQFIKEKRAYDGVNRIWREGLKEEHPLESYKRINNLSQSQLNDEFGEFAMKMVDFDFGAREYIIQAKTDPNYACRRFTTLIPIEGPNRSFKVPFYFAPSDYGYNVVQIRPDSPTSTIEMVFWGHRNDPAGGASYRFGFVATSDGSRRYSPLFRSSQGEEVTMRFTITPSDKDVYLVVLGAPLRHHNYKFEEGWPKFYRYPWQISLKGAMPFAKNQLDVPGAPHPNGGGFVAATAKVAPSVYVSPAAYVMGDARLEGNVRVEDSACVAVAFSARDNVVIRHAAWALHSSSSGSAIIEESSCHVATESSGSFIGGGDMEDHGKCDAGNYKQVHHPNNGRKQCDRLTNSAANQDVNPQFPDHRFSENSNRSPQIVSQVSNLAFAAKLTTSHVSPWERIDALRDGYVSGAGYGNWDGEGNYGKWNWVEFDFGSNKKINSIDVYWWEEAALLRPNEAYISYYDGSNWVRSFGLTNVVNGWNTVGGGYVTRKIRVYMKSERATGILECQIFGEQSTDPVVSKPVVTNPSVQNPPPTQGVENLALKATLSTSHVSPWEKLDALRDGYVPKNSADNSGGGYGNWDGEGNYGKWNWVEFDFGSNKKIYSIDVYWWEENAGLLRPNEAYISYYDGSNWVRSFGLTNVVNGWNTVGGGYITRKIRVYMKSERATGILECQIFGEPSNVVFTPNPTPSPTRDPTPSPTHNPTPSPTRNPTPSPTHNPTPSPTRNPTPSPIRNPTPSPTPEPASNPTPSPTLEATSAPTRKPALEQSPHTTPVPSSQETIRPTSSRSNPVVTISPVGVTKVEIFHTNFSKSKPGFKYVDDLFHDTGRPDYAEGTYNSTGKCLEIKLGGVDQEEIWDMSGGWIRHIHIPRKSQGVILLFEYSVTLSGASAKGNFVEILARFGKKEVGPNGVVDKIEANNHNVIIRSGIRTFQVDVGPKRAGNYLVTLGAFLNHKEGIKEDAKICFLSVTVKVIYTS